MTIIESVIRDEYDRNLRMQEAYRQEIKKLPRGSITRKVINGKTYHYWMYRDGRNVVNKYISRKDNDIDELTGQVEKRRQLEGLMRNLKKEQREMERFMKVSGNG